ncbi:unnamed protein product [Orchesella dallaii]|uniref:Uncharacterized protein n=1 Tax=Orchesella dallaii TaxID=48710 RepID=A0ABP1QLA8_9HEXA
MIICSQRFCIIIFQFGIGLEFGSTHYTLHKPFFQDLEKLYLPYSEKITLQELYVVATTYLDITYACRIVSCLRIKATFYRRDDEMLTQVCIAYCQSDQTSQTIMKVVELREKQQSTRKCFCGESHRESMK